MKDIKEVSSQGNQQEKIKPGLTNGRDEEVSEKF